MAGLNYGNRFRKRHAWYGKDGCFFVPQRNEWIVRINNKTLTSFKNKTEAEKFYQLKLSTIKKAS